MPRRSIRLVYDKKLGKVVEIADPVRPVRGVARWPIHSDAMAINPSQIGEAQAVLASCGVRTEYDSEGRPVLTDAKHRRRHAEALGFYDRNGGYGDPQRNT